MRSVIATTAIALMLGAGVTLTAQKTTQVHPGKGGSPHVRTSWTVDGANISIEYGRPSLKGRSESELMPPGRDGGPVVVRGRESRLHGEGVQRVRSSGDATAGARR